MIMKCEFGCGKEAIHQLKSGKWICAKYSAQCDVNKQKNAAGIKKAMSEGRLSYDGRYDNLPDDVKRRMNWNKGKFTGTEFEYGGRGNHKGALIVERGHRCESCNNTEWLGNPITIELDHIDGDRHNNVKDNLRLLCPNCHSQTKTWRGRNINSGKTKVSDEEILSLIRNGVSNPRQLLLEVGLAPKGGNYRRVYKLMGLDNQGGSS
jgi:5-methylcytosine-specific restriction endonuclease McrA